MPPCAAHPGREAVGACAACGAAVCVACAREYAGARICERCLPAWVEADRERPPDVSATASHPAGPVRRVRVLLAAYVLVFGGVAGACAWLYFAGGPSIEDAKQKARARACAEALERVYRAAALYAADHAGVLPRPEDGRVETLARDLVARGYLDREPKRLCPAAVAPDALGLGDGAKAYLYDDDARHDGKRNVITATGIRDRRTTP